VSLDLDKVQEDLNEVNIVGRMIDELRALRSNMTTTQARCTELLQENRRLNREIGEQEYMITAQLRLIGQLEGELNELKGANILATHG
jgi:seryl-tRNA synthetase